MLAYQYSGFSVDAGVCIQAHDRAALARLLRYCARPPFAMERLRKEGAALVYPCAKQRSEPTSDKRGVKADEITLTPLELIDRIAALMPPPRTHRHRYFGVLAPNSPLRCAVTALAQGAAVQPATAQAEPASTGEGALGVVPQGNAVPPTPEPAPPKRSPAHYLWAVLIARIYEVFPALNTMRDRVSESDQRCTHGAVRRRDAPRESGQGDQDHARTRCRHENQIQGNSAWWTGGKHCGVLMHTAVISLATA